MKINRTQINNLITLTSKEIKKLEESRNTSTLSDVAIDEKIEELNALFSLLSLEYFDTIATDLNVSTNYLKGISDILTDVNENKL
tara:strand:+ start:1103 stop:1357 length:255 start_codon:yes stop_codon:yes gene_type:complete